MGIITSVGEDITFEKQDGSNLLPNVDYYIAIPAVKMEGLKLVIKDENGKVLQSLTKSTFTPSSNTIYNLGTIEPAPTANVGDYYYSDGTYSTTLDASKTVVGVVFYTGDPTADDETLKKDYPDCIHGLVVGLTPTSRQSIGSKADGSWDRAGFMTTVGADWTYGVGYVILQPGYLMTGYNNTQAIRYADPQAPSISICDGMQTVPNASKWFVPSVAEFGVINSVRDIVNASINNVRGEGLYGDYLTSTEIKSYSTCLAKYNVNDRSLSDVVKIEKDSGAKIRVIFAF